MASNLAQMRAVLANQLEVGKADGLPNARDVALAVVALMDELMEVEKRTGFGGAMIHTDPPQQPLQNSGVGGVANAPTTTAAVAGVALTNT